jgi:hypothetical protein
LEYIVRSKVNIGLAGILLVVVVVDKLVPAEVVTELDPVLVAILLVPVVVTLVPDVVEFTALDEVRFVPPLVLLLGILS